MSDLKAQLELTTDASGVEAGFSKAKRSINSFGATVNKAGSSASNSIDKYVKRLDVQNKTLGKSVRETELYKLALRGASDAQLKAADSALKLRERTEKIADGTAKAKIGFIALAAAAGAAAGGVLVATGRIVDQIASYQGLSEKIGDTAQNVASLQVASDMSGVAMDAVTASSIRLTASLSKTDDESKGAGKAIAALGLDFRAFKALGPVEQLDAVANAMAGFADGSEKTAIAVALFGKSGADLMPFLNDLANNGERQIRLTDRQIAAADDYTKAQAALKSEFRSFLQLSAADAVPILTDVQNILAEIAKDEATVSVVTETMKGALAGAVTVFQTIAVVGANVGFVFLGIGREIGAITAQLAMLAQGDIKGFRAISNAVKEDGERARAELDKFEARVMGIGKPVENPANYSNEGRQPTTPSKPRLSTVGLAETGNAAGQEASARLAADLDRIRKASDSVANTFSNAEKIMQANRAAGLINEREYYAAKLAFIRLNSTAQEGALQEELARLQKEKLSGKEKIDNDRKIADVQAKLAKVRADAVANIEVLGAQEVAANNKVAKSYEDARNAAQDYIEAITRQNAREIGGVGKGAQFREQQAGINAIEDKRTGEQQKLGRDRRNGLISEDEYARYLEIVNETYAKEVELYNARTAAIKEAQGDWRNGATEAFENYRVNAENAAAQSAEAFTGLFTGLEDGFANSISSAIVLGEDLSGSLRGVALNVADEFIAAGVKMATQWAISQASMTSATAVGVATRSSIEQAAAADSVLLWGGAAVKNIMASAWEAMAGAYKAIAGIPIVGPVLAPVAAGVAFGAVAGMAKKVTGGRALGGPVSAGKLYEVNERGPELLSAGGKDFLMMGQHSGIVTPNDRLGVIGGASDGGMKLTIVNQTSGRIDNVIERQISPNERALIIQESTANALDATAAQFSDPNSKISRSFGRNFNSQRSR